MSMASVDCNFINQECVLEHTTVFATRIDFIQIAYDKSVNRGKNKWYVVHTTYNRNNNTATKYYKCSVRLINVCAHINS